MNEPKELAPIVPDANMTRALDSQRSTAWNVMNQLASSDEDENIAFSPMSLYMSMSMLYAGADGVCAEELSDFLNCDGADFHEYNRQILTSLPYIDSKTVLKFANSLWADQYFSLNSDFTNTLTDNYLAQSFSFDSNSQNVAQRINEWIANSTSGLIPSHLDTNKEINGLCLAGTLYFKSPWSKPFKKSDTAKGKFMCANGEPRTVDRMNGTFENVMFAEVNRAKIATLPFGNGNFMISFVLPPEGMDLREYIRENDITALSAASKTSTVRMTLPKFSLQSKIDMKKILKKMGIKEIFEKSVWSKMINEDYEAKVSDIDHSVFFNIDEEGGTAAAVNTVIMVVSSNNLPAPNVFCADRPFFYMITDRTCNIPILMGTVEKF